MHVVSAFEQSLSNVTLKLQKLTVASERKVISTVSVYSFDLRDSVQGLFFSGGGTGAREQFLKRAGQRSKSQALSSNMIR